MRPVLRAGAYPVAVEGGMSILTHQGWVRLAGRSAAPWIVRLAPYLDGTRTLADLTGSLTAERRKLVEQLVATLYQQGVVRDAGEDGSDPAGSRVDSPEVRFVSYFRDGAAEAVARWRAGTALVVGTGPVATALVAAAHRAGVAQVRVLGPDPEQTDLATGVAEADLVLHVADRAAAGRAARLERCCARAGVALAQVMIDGREAWLVPADQAGAGTWSAAWPRLSANLRPAERPARPIGRTAAALVASQLVHGAFQVATGVAPPADQQQLALARVDLDTLGQEVHPVLPDPLTRPAPAATEAEFRCRVAELARGQRLTGPELSWRAARCRGARLGVFDLPDRDWEQSPLHVSEAVVGPVRPLSGGGARESVVGAGFGLQAARCQAALRALARYAALAIDPRRLVGAGAVWGQVLAEPAGPRLVPAAVAFPTLAGHPPGVGFTGVAGGFDWSEALAAGLLADCRRFALAALARASRRYPPVDLDAVPLDRTGQRCRAILAAAGEPLAVYDLTGLTGELGVPAYGFCLGGTTVAYQTGLTPGAAVRDGLLRVLRWLQARIHDQPGYAPAPVPELPERLRGRIADPPPDRPAVDIATVAGRMRAQGRLPVAVPLDHDPAVTELVPYLVRVVILDA